MASAASEDVGDMMTTLLGVIEGISLLVGEIGMINIMFVSVTERTKEIGLRLSVGGKERDILIQFLIESVLNLGFFSSLFFASFFFRTGLFIIIYC